MTATLACFSLATSAEKSFSPALICSSSVMATPSAFRFLRA